jgi:TonB family protein
MKATLIRLLLLMACSLPVFADVEQDTRTGLLEHTVVVRGYYVEADLHFDQTGHLTSPATQGFGPSGARIYITNVLFEPSRLLITGRRTFPAYAAKAQQFRVALLQEETKLDIALPTDEPLDQAVRELLKEVFLPTSELQQTAACPADERKEFEDRLMTFNEKQKHQKPKTHDKTGDAAALSDVPQICMPMGERAYIVQGEVQPPKAVKTPDPVYSEAARRARIEGTVILFVVIDAQGRPATVYVGRSLDHDLDRAAVEAVQHWTFAPATFKGTAIPVAINAEINFRLN